LSLAQLDAFEAKGGALLTQANALRTLSTSLARSDA
jgi:hypothetical protein